MIETKSTARMKSLILRLFSVYYRNDLLQHVNKQAAHDGELIKKTHKIDYMSVKWS